MKRKVNTYANAIILRCFFSCSWFVLFNSIYRINPIACAVFFLFISWLKFVHIDSKNPERLKRSFVFIIFLKLFCTTKQCKNILIHFEWYKRDKWLGVIAFCEERKKNRFVYTLSENCQSTYSCWWCRLNHQFCFF